jgi:hypothetical protein
MGFLFFQILSPTMALNHPSEKFVPEFYPWGKVTGARI